MSEGDGGNRMLELSLEKKKTSIGGQLSIATEKIIVNKNTLPLANDSISKSDPSVSLESNDNYDDVATNSPN
jgi:hypothetical protein